MGALIATHNPDLARRMDRVVTLADGRVVPG
jgi:lipoprotein-releasing system ATP-binding protein